MIVVYAGPTCGKTTFMRTGLQGYSFLDTDNLIEMLTPSMQDGLPILAAASTWKGRTADEAMAQVWDVWKHQLPQVNKERIIVAMGVFIDAWRRRFPQATERVIVVTNIWRLAAYTQIDLAYWRKDRDEMVDLVRQRRLARGTEFTSKAEAEIRSWKAPDSTILRTELRMLERDEYLTGIVSGVLPIPGTLPVAVEAVITPADIEAVRDSDMNPPTSAKEQV